MRLDGFWRAHEPIQPSRFMRLQLANCIRPPRVARAGALVLRHEFAQESLMQLAWLARSHRTLRRRVRLASAIARSCSWVRFASASGA